MRERWVRLGMRWRASATLASEDRAGQRCSPSARWLRVGALRSSRATTCSPISMPPYPTASLRRSRKASCEGMISWMDVSSSRLNRLRFASPSNYTASAVSSASSAGQSLHSRTAT